MRHVEEAGLWLLRFDPKRPPDGYLEVLAAERGERARAEPFVAVELQWEVRRTGLVLADVHPRRYASSVSYRVLVKERAAEDLDALRPYDAARIVAAIRQQLTAEPTLPARNRKPLLGFVPSFEHELPVWELRVGEFRVFYSVEESAGLVHVWAIVAKGRKTTGELS